MIEINFIPAFIRQYEKLKPDLKKEVFEKIEELKNKNNHKKLKVHKLKGKFKDLYSFSVNYSHRIIFKLKNKEAILIEIGDHEIYK